MPERLSDELARRIIDRVFASEGFDLQRDVPITLAAGRFLASGYDVKRRIGYIFVATSNLDAGAFVDFRIAEIHQNLQRCVERQMSSLQTVLFRAKRLPMDLAEAHYESDLLQTNYIPFVLTLEQEKEAMEAGKIIAPWKRLAALTRVAVKSAESLIEKYQVDDDELLKLQLLAQYIHPSLHSERRQIMATADPEARKMALQGLLAKDADAKLSLVEAQELQTDSFGGRIAVISQFDSRFEYQSVYHAASSWTLRSLLDRHNLEQARIRAIHNPVARLQAQLDWEEANSQGTNRELECQVRNFLAWARSIESR